jgi:repressor LexA
MWEAGRSEPTGEMYALMSFVLDCTVGYLMGTEEYQRPQDAPPLPSNVRPISALHRQRIPLIGSVAAGEPIHDPEELGVYVDSPVDADAAITIRGDSMIPTYQDGDVVYIKCRPDVPEGAVAVVFLDDEAALKHVYKRPTGLTLISDNPDHPPIMAEFEDYPNMRIFGVPVGYTRIFKADPLRRIKKGF